MKGSGSTSPYIAELDRLYEDANYSSQTYFEAAKSAEFWGKFIVFWPALASAAASLLVATGQSRQWGAVGAVAGAIAATASFLGSDRKSSSLKETARKFTTLRHSVRYERNIATNKSDDELDQVVRTLREQYNLVVSGNEVVSNRFFDRARKRILTGVLDYSADKTQP